MQGKIELGLRILMFLVLWPRPLFCLEPEEKANSLHLILTNGVPLLSENPLYSSIVSKIRSGDLSGAARIITDPQRGSRDFYDGLVAGIPQHWNRDNQVSGDRNEMSALFVGTVRDNHPIKDVLTKDRIYFDPTLTGDRGYLENPSLHFKTIWDTKSPRDSLRPSDRPGFQGVGIFTSHPWGSSYIDAGTNRRPIYGILNHLYCTTMQSVQTLLLPDSQVRRDIPRAPGGDVRQYFSNCVSCHAFLDALIPRAFSRYDFMNGKLTYQFPRDKLNEVNFSESTITDDSWLLYLTPQTEPIFGLRDLPNRSVQRLSGTNLKFISGSGLKELADWIANSRGFYRCLVKQLISRMYLKKQFNLNALKAEDFNAIQTQEKFIEEQAEALFQSQNLRETIENIAVEYTSP